jgi:hypothetical protein
MQRTWMFGLIACADAFAAEPEAWRVHLAKDLVKITADKWEIDEYAVCRSRPRKGNGGDFLWRSHVEIVPFDGMSRDNAVSLWSGTETIMHQQFGRELNPKDPDNGWECRPLLAPVEGLPTFTLEMRMDPDGFGFWLDSPDGTRSTEFRATWAEAYAR